ncbi:TPA: lytic transglycosylase domain-containing protein [Yersinia enterocolitica]|uniref:lytic transglycosylase domain-containing protein n=1 Tax=Yersinia enterocolitica TaxID=630 RepID=UPI001C67C4CD|nr:lytic transglycosylase domain-containing protein [Yersinia enterocolitica]EKN4095955.1 lytic transglycosylase domain-containing protein [Yersinia enterocolitica]EKN4745560.1 lytic transglycosylase domain-containing protein [Yersinia enterocolitica]EKN5965006.1 lytic transglycosylase domain-containing protein [Yersinia enterocolitica]EKN6145227.1 lytic transglycosylase domain-containing protein [Yersinia enterocolitica]MBW5861660.1 lytic transglycosylase domain-containing protein [Yersinia e
MIIEELAYKVTIKADEFLNGKRKVNEEVTKLEKDFDRTGKNINRTLKTSATDFTQFGNAAVSSFRGVTAAAAGFLGIGAGLYGIKQLFTSTANEIVRASQQAKFFGSDVNKMFGVQRGFKQAGLNGDAFIGASGNARMALANIKDPTIFGGLTGAAQNLMVLGARTGLNINQLGDPNKALSEFSRYGKTHSQENLMQVMSAAGFDPTDAAKIKSGELKSLVDSETKKSNITAQQVKEQERLVATLGQLDAEFDRLRQDIAIAFAPDVIVAMKEFGAWIRDHHGDIIGFFREAGDSIKKLTDSVGGATALLILLAAGLRANPLVMGAIAAAAASNRIDSQREEARKQGKSLGQYLVDKGHEDKTPFLTWDSIKSLLGFDEVTQYGQSSRLSQTEPRGMDDLLHGVMMTESGGNPLAYNASSGAAGAYQFMPATAREMGLKVNGQEDERLDPEKSRAAASVYLRRLLKKYDGNTDNALRAYNWGMGNVDKWIANGSNPADLPKETREYTGKVRGNMGDARNYYATQGRLADGNQYQLSSSGGNPQITNSTNINTVNVNSNPQTVDALTQSIQRQSQRSSTNASFSSAVR